MAELEIKDKNNTAVGKMELPEQIFGIKAKDGVVHNAVVNFLANQRQGTHATKTKGLVSGGGKKPWKQKHTGRARAGSSRSPLWRGGGITFGPQPRDYSYALPKNAKRLAVDAVLSGKAADGEISIINELALDKPNTKEMNSILKKFGFAGKSTLIIIEDKNPAVVLSARNIPGVSVVKVTEMNAYQLAAHSRILMTKRAVEKLAEAGN